MARPGRLAAVVTVVALVLAAYVAWRWYARHHTVSPGSALTSQCDQVPDSAQRVTLTAEDGRRLGGALVGPDDAAVGVVFRQGASQTICEWLPEAGELADRAGVRVLLFDRRGFGSSPGDADLAAEPGDLATATAMLRERGVDQVILMASSMGNSVLFTALPTITPAPCAVVSISPVLTSSDPRGSLDGSALRGLPGNLWITWETGNPGVAEAAERIAAVVPQSHTLSVDTAHHSIGLVTQHAEVRAFLADAARSCT